MWISKKKIIEIEKRISKCEERIRGLDEIQISFGKGLEIQNEEFGKLVNNIKDGIIESVVDIKDAIRDEIIDEFKRVQ